MIVKIDMYTVKCDNCGITSGENSDYSCWCEAEYAEEDATESDWIKGEKHYCPDCYSYDDEDNLVLNQKRFKETKDESLSERSEKITLLEAYSKFLQKEGYLDTDWNSEPPFAIDEFLKTQE